MDQLINLIDHDSDDDFIDQLYDTQEADNPTSADHHQDVADSNDGGAGIASEDNVPRENISSM